MDLPAVINRLQAACDAHELVTITDLSEMFGVHDTTIRRWMHVLNFPRSMEIERVRLFRPDECIAWTREQFEAERGTLTLDAACAIVNLNPQTFTQWVKQGKLPAPARRELGSGRHLWSAKEIDEWMQRRTGGYKRPSHNKPPREVKPVVQGRRGPKQHLKIQTLAH